MRALTAFVNELGEFVVYDPQTHELRVFESQSGSVVALKAQIPETPGDLTFELPNRLAPSGLKSVLVVTPAGRMQLQDPSEYLSDLATYVFSALYQQAEVNTAIADIVAKVNAILAALRNQNIIQPADVRITPSPAKCYCATNGPLELFTPPATAASGAYLIQTPGTGVGTINPTVEVA